MLAEGRAGMDPCCRKQLSGRVPAKAASQRTSLWIFWTAVYAAMTGWV